MVDNQTFIDDRKRAIQDSPLSYTFFMTYNFPPFIRDWDYCSDLVSYFLPNAISQEFNLILEVGISGIHREYAKSHNKTIGHAHIIGSSSKKFWNNPDGMKDFLDDRCFDFLQRRRPSLKPSFHQVAQSIRARGRNRTPQMMVPNKVPSEGHKSHSFKCVDYDSELEGVRYIFSHHTIIPYNNPIFDRRRSQRAKKNNV